MSDHGGSVSVPPVLRYVSGVALVAGCALIFLGGWRLGVTWDEPLHVQRFNNYLQTGWYMADGQLDHGRPAPDMTQQYVYAPASMLLLHGLNVLVGVDDPGAAGSSAQAYAVRHVGIGILSLVCLLAVAATARLLFRRWDWALVSAGLLAALPMWAGHSMYNLKDVPVATGYSLLTLGLCAICRPDRHIGGWRLRVLGPLSIATGALLAIGTRPGIWVGFAASVLALLGCCHSTSRTGSWLQRVRASRWRYEDLALGLLISGIGLWLIYPRAFSSPVEELWNAAFASANFLDTKASPSYVPLHVMFKLPVLVLGFVCLGVYAAVRQLMRARWSFGAFETRIVLILVQTFTLPVVAMVHGASLYGDLRQLLFAAPSTVLIATLGIRHLVGLARARSDDRTRSLVTATACSTLVLPLAGQATLFPYDYAYYNPLATAIDLPVIGDYYRASGRELAPHLPVRGRIVCSPETDEVGDAMRMAHLDGWVDCRTGQVSPISPYRDRIHGSFPSLGPSEFWAVMFKAHTDTPRNCVPITGLSRRLGWRRLPMATLLKCSRSYPVLSEREVAFTAASVEGADYPDLGWYAIGMDGSAQGIRSQGGVSSMKFSVTPRFVGHDVLLSFETSTSTIPLTTFGRVAVTAVRAAHGQGFSVRLPALLVRRATSEAQELTFASTSSDSLDLRILGLHAKPVDSAQELGGTSTATPSDS